jgi:hypothetical protein
MFIHYHISKMFNNIKRIISGHTGHRNTRRAYSSDSRLHPLSDVAADDALYAAFLNNIRAEQPYTPIEYARSHRLTTALIAYAVICPIVLLVGYMSNVIVALTMLLGAMSYAWVFSAATYGKSVDLTGYFKQERIVLECLVRAGEKLGLDHRDYTWRQVQAIRGDSAAARGGRSAWESDFSAQDSALLGCVERIGDLLALDPDEFEYACATILEVAGFRNVEQTGGSGDGGCDVQCTTPYGDRCVVQCKRYAPERRVGAETIQNIEYTMNSRRAKYALVMTTSEFTKGSRDTAGKIKDGQQVILLSGEDLMRIISSGWAEPLESLVR